MVPVRLPRAQTLELEFALHPEDSVPDDFVIVPGGTYLSGRADALVEKSLGDFAIMSRPITLSTGAVVTSLTRSSRSRLPGRPWKPAGR